MKEAHKKLGIPDEDFVMPEGVIEIEKKDLQNLVKLRKNMEEEQ